MANDVVTTGAGRRRVLLVAVAVVVALAAVGAAARPWVWDQYLERTSSTTPRCSPAAADALAEDPIFTASPAPTTGIRSAPTGGCRLLGESVFLADASYDLVRPRSEVAAAYAGAARDQGWTLGPDPQDVCATRVVDGHTQELGVVFSGVDITDGTSFFWVTINADDDPAFRGC